jgi:phytoene dehydrogenase-like protein
MPRFAGVDSLAAAYPDVDLFGPTATVCPSPEQLDAAHADRAAGRVADKPTLLINVPSALDPTMAPETGKHVLSLEVLFTPYNHPGGWPNSTEPQRWIDLWAGFSEPGSADLITQWRAMTPDRYENEFSMFRGYTPAYAGSPMSALLAKQPELTRYRTPIDGLYLSGAGTFPGAGVFGASGRNTADVVRRDLTAGVIQRAKRWIR